MIIFGCAGDEVPAIKQRAMSTNYPVDVHQQKVFDRLGTTASLVAAARRRSIAAG